MAYLIGMDEAGYGPNLGPLVIAATAWRVDTSTRGRCQPADETRLDQIDLYDLLSDVVTRAPDDDGRLAITDSKLLYRPGGRLGLLERGVLAALASIGKRPGSWRELIDLLAADPRGAVDTLPWYSSFDLPLPVDPPAVGPRLTDEQRVVSVRAVRGRAVFAEEFNALVAQHDNKATALTTTSLKLLDDMLAAIGPSARSEPVLAVCDKHGGRNRYGPALQRQFPDHLVEIRGESRVESRYTWGPPHAKIDVRFRKGGEAFLPTALASMTAKYVRELALRFFNAYWQQHVPGLRPTAGYPVDARRFKQEIAARQKELKIDDRTLWRSR